MILEGKLKQIMQAQFLAALAMLEEVLTHCPDELWQGRVAKDPFWHIAYHTLFYTHLYLQRTEEDFAPWAKHRPEYNFLGTLPWPPHDPPKIGEPYTRAEILEYLAFVRQEVRERYIQLDLAAESGFAWLHLSKMELLVYSLRHLQQHVGELSGYLGAQAGIEIDWVGTRAI